MITIQSTYSDTNVGVLDSSGLGEPANAAHIAFLNHSRTWWKTLKSAFHIDDRSEIARAYGRLSKILRNRMYFLFRRAACVKMALTVAQLA